VAKARDAEFDDVSHPCPFCGGTRFHAGHLRSQEGTWIWFESDARGFLDGLTGVGKGDVRTRMCVNCRHLDLFVPQFTGR
jgi:hypothetical protein